MGIDDACAATPAAKLKRRICDPNVPKTEAEWWAQGEISRLQEQITELCAEKAGLLLANEHLRHLLLDKETCRCKFPDRICDLCWEKLNA